MKNLELPGPGSVPPDAWPPEDVPRLHVRKYLFHGIKPVFRRFSSTLMARDQG
jgi:hypothetical protein